jgi:hypothetical protein
MRGPDPEYQVERVRGTEVRGLLVVQCKAILDAQTARGLTRLSKGVLGAEGRGVHERCTQQLFRWLTDVFAYLRQ